MNARVRHQRPGAYQHGLAQRHRRNRHHARANLWIDLAYPHSRRVGPHIGKNHVVGTQRAASAKPRRSPNGNGRNAMNQPYTGPPFKRPPSGVGTHIGKNHVVGTQRAASGPGGGVPPPKKATPTRNKPPAGIVEEAQTGYSNQELDPAERDYGTGILSQPLFYVLNADGLDAQAKYPDSPSTNNINTSYAHDAITIETATKQQPSPTNGRRGRPSEQQAREASDIKAKYQLAVYELRFLVENASQANNTAATRDGLEILMQTCHELRMRGQQPTQIYRTLMLEAPTPRQLKLF